MEHIVPHTSPHTHGKEPKGATPAPISRETFLPIVEEIIAKSKHYLSPKEGELIRQAYEFAYTAHEGQQRFSGDPYITHPLAATKILLRLEPDVETIIACMLHDVPENTDYTLEQIEELFGPVVTSLITGIVNLSSVHYTNPDETEMLKKLFLAITKDIRIIFIKLSERLHNIYTLPFIPDKAKQKRVAEETLYVYAPIANRLGLLHLKSRLEDACFKFLFPEEYATIRERLEQQANSLQHVLNESIAVLKTKLQENHILAEVYGRVKTPYSIFSKMKRKGLHDIQDLYDLLAVRVIVQHRDTCYRVLGIVHTYWTPITSRIKDYIAKPKKNNYQSIHTVVLGVDPHAPEQPLEIQIRSRHMHEEAEYGNAAYAVYKEKGKTSHAEQFDWYKDLRNLARSSGSDLDFYKEEIFTLTPEGEILILPKGATPVDFAYGISDTLGDTCWAAKVNGEKVPLDYQLKSGQTVEILRKHERLPNATWLSFVVTEKAKSHIQNYFQEQDEEKLFSLGISMLNTYLKQKDKPRLAQEMSILGRALQHKKDSLENRKALLIQIAKSQISLEEVYKKLYPVESISPSAPQGNNEVVIDGEHNISYRIARCCKPTRGQDIQGYVTRDGNISVHRAECHFLLGGNKDRIINCTWK